MKLGLHWKLERRDWLILAVISALPLVYVPLRSHYGEAIPGVAARLPDVRFGVGRFEDCGYLTEVGVMECAHGCHNLLDMTASVVAAQPGFRALGPHRGGGASGGGVRIG